MRAIIVFTFLIGLLGHDQLREAEHLGERSAASSAIAVRATEAAAPVLNKSEPAAHMRGQAELAPDASALEAPIAEVKQDAFALNAVNDLTLYDSREDVRDKLGEPDSIERDEYLKDAVTFHYGDMSIYFYQDYIQSIDFAATVKELNIDGVIVQVNAEALKAALGKPDYVAEDGIVFQRNDCLLKMFMDGQTGERLGVSYYHLASV
ncbi:DUF4309 domain-containing protein [Paenibacillus sp. HB172176]|uniref:DUF4309 domain-containing protein n=1 Tax=Paenibacillus sp. HB172176 TaxID=2493690 RepID=UPI00143BE64C|nr:DUF4309 domain-containing protein [Paenibacillus sp. HB172176]